MFKRKSKSNEPRLRRLTNEPVKTSSYSYYANRDERKDQPRRDQEELEKRVPKQSLLINHLISGLVILVILFVLVDFFRLNSEPQINLVPSSNSTALLQSNSDYQAAAQSVLQKSILNENKITVNTGSVGNALMKKFPELSNVSVTIPFSGHQLQIFIQPTQPILLLNTGTKIFVVGKSGLVIGQRNSSTQAALAKLILPTVNVTGLNTSIGSQALSSDDAAFMSYISQELQAQHLNLASLSIVPNSRELDVSIAGQAYIVKFNLQGDDKEQVGSYLALRQYLSQNKITPTQYVDVRVSGRAYYK